MRLLQDFKLLLSLLTKPAGVAFYFWPETLNLINLRNFIRLKRDVVVFPNSPDDSRYAQFGFSQSNQSLCVSIDIYYISHVQQTFIQQRDDLLELTHKM